MTTLDQHLSLFSDELLKISATRYEKEIAKGTLSRDQIVPGLEEHQNLFADHGQDTTKRLTRNLLTAPAPVDPQALARRRAMANHQFNVQRRIGEYSPGQTATMLPNNLPPTTTAYKGQQPIITVGDDAAKYINNAESFTPKGIIAKLTNRVAPQVSLLRSMKAIEQLPDQAHDPTLRKAILQHEFGEANATNKDTVRPFASHVGAEPILRENMAIAGDPDAVAAVQRARAINPEDAMMQKLIRRAGGTPDAPLPLGGRHERAIARMQDRAGAALLTQKGREYSLATALAGWKVPYVPNNVAESMQDLRNHEKMIEPWRGVGTQIKNRNFLGLAKGAVGNVKNLLQNARTVGNFIKGVK